MSGSPAGLPAQLRPHVEWTARTTRDTATYWSLMYVITRTLKREGQFMAAANFLSEAMSVAYLPEEEAMCELLMLAAYYVELY